MGSCREGFDLFNSFGRKHFFKRGLLGDKWARHYVLKDTLGKYICKIIGHSKTFNTDDIPPNKCCLRCFKIIVKEV
jgi:hypothetical protein